MARSLYARWRALPATPTAHRIEPLAEDAKRSALALRGATDRERAEADLRGQRDVRRRAGGDRRGAIPSWAKPRSSELREDLSRELERLATPTLRLGEAPRSRTRHTGSITELSSGSLRP